MLVEIETCEQEEDERPVKANEDCFMFTKVETDEILTEEEANERYFPNSYIMVECFYEGLTLNGRVVAYAPLKKSMGLTHYSRELNLSGKYGLVVITDTKDPFEGRSLFYEIHCVKEE